MTLRILHVLDHSLPLHSGYTFRTLALLREQRRRGWQTLMLTTPKQGASAALQDEAEGWSFFRTPSQAGDGLFRQMQLTAARLRELIAEHRPDLRQQAQRVAMLSGREDAKLGIDGEAQPEAQRRQIGVRRVEPRGLP